MIGFDYGIKPGFLAVGDAEYPNLLFQADPCAMGYGRIPHFGLLHQPPFVCIIFNNREKGIECCKHFHRWAELSQDGDAVSLSFIDKNEGGYVVCIYPEFNRLIDRCIPKYLSAEVQPLVMAPICFPLIVPKTSEQYLTFKQQAKNNPFVFSGASKESGLFLDLAIRKRYVQFYKENEIPSNTPEGNYFRMPAAKNKQIPFEIKPIVESPQQIKARRQKRLATFFPVTLEILKYQSEFRTVKKFLLNEGFKQWQIIQGTCNTVISCRMSGHPHFMAFKEKFTQIDLLDRLLQTFEEPNVQLPSSEFLTVEIIRKQIVLDTIELLKYVHAEPKNTSKEVLLKIMKDKGLLINHV